MTTLAQVTEARKVAQAQWEQVQRAKEMAVAAERRYKALLYEFYAEENPGDNEQPLPVAGALGLPVGRQGQAAREKETNEGINIDSSDTGSSGSGGRGILAGAPAG